MTMFFRLRKEATLRSAVRFAGIGVHSGIYTNVTVLPSRDGAGITFKRTDIKHGSSIIELSPMSVVDPTMCTRIVNKDGVSVAVIEHLLAALRICKITNAEVEVDSGEIPILDGSAIEFVNAFKQSGIVFQSSLVPTIRISEPISVSYKSAHISIKPSNKQKCSVTLDYDRINPVIGKSNSYSFNFNDDLEDMAQARTFGWIADYDKVRALGFAKGASEDNTIVITEDSFIKNKEGLRNKREIVMHKCLDLIGDFSTLGYDILGEITAINPSHYANNLLMKTLLKESYKHDIIAGKQDNVSELLQVA